MSLKQAHFACADEILKEGSTLTALCGEKIPDVQFLDYWQSNLWKGRKIKDLVKPESQETEINTVSNCGKCLNADWQGSIVYQIASRRKQEEEAA